MKLLNFLPCFLLVVACSQQSEIEKAVSAQLKDPSSAQFKNIVVDENLDRACTQWNAKNSFGGYGEWQVAELWRINSKWTVVEMNASNMECSLVGLKAADAGFKAKTEAIRNAVSLLVSNGMITKNEAEKVAQDNLSSNHKCGYVIWKIGNAAREIAESTIRGENVSLFHESELEKDMTAAREGSCVRASVFVRDN